jgi:hypothetical protein
MPNNASVEGSGALVTVVMVAKLVCVKGFQPCVPASLPAMASVER